MRAELADAAFAARLIHYGLSLRAAELFERVVSRLPRRGFRWRLRRSTANRAKD
jgi:hypothetical protein